MAWYGMVWWYGMVSFREKEPASWLLSSTVPLSQSNYCISHIHDASVMNNIAHYTFSSRLFNAFRVGWPDCSFTCVVSQSSLHLSWQRVSVIFKHESECKPLTHPNFQYHYLKERIGGTFYFLLHRRANTSYDQNYCQTMVGMTEYQTDKVWQSITGQLAPWFSSVLPLKCNWNENVHSTFHILYVIILLIFGPDGKSD